MGIEETVQSPCINICELGDDDICSGCFRTLDEIACWGYASNDERKNIIDNASQRKIAGSND